MLSPLEVPRRSVVPGAISSADQISSLVATKPTLEGEQVTTRRFSPVAERGIRADLKGNLRAFQVHGRRQPDARRHAPRRRPRRRRRHVQVPASPAPRRDTFYASRVVLRDLKVLKAPNGPARGHQADERAPEQLLGDARRHRPAGPEAPLRDDPDGRQHAATASGWSLELRPVLHAADSPESVTTLDTVLRDGLGAAQLRRYSGSFGGGQ